MSTPVQDAERPRDFLPTIHALSVRIVECDWSRTLLIKAAVEDGATWKDIADALGVSPQAAWKKYRTQEPREIMPGQDTLPIE